MGSGDRGEGEAFKANFSSDGVAKLRETVMEKLKEFLGDYTDDTLVEYVIVLLKNGRRKEEAENELDVFLGDDSSPFISWLWDHLGSNLHLYVQSPGIPPPEVAQPKVTVEEPAVSVSVVKSASHKLESGLEKGRYNESCKSHHPKELKGLEGDGNKHRTLKSCIVESNHAVEDGHQKVDGVKRSDSLQEGAQRKRFRSEESASMKRDEVQQAAIAAPRRLLQFAVRDAVAKARPSNLMTDPSLKRLRSVVSTASEDSPLEEQSQSCQLQKVSNNMPTSIVVDATKDVKRVRPSRNVFDRLGRTADVSDVSRQLTGFGVDFAGDTCDRPRSEIKEYLTQYKEQNASHFPLSHRDTEMAFDPESKYDKYDDMDARRHRAVHVPMNGTSVRKKEDSSLIFQYNVAKKASRGAQETRAHEDKLVPVPDTTQKTANTSAGMNTWRSPQYQEMRGSIMLDIQKSESGMNALNVTEAKKVHMIGGNGIIKPKANTDKEPQKMQLSAPGLSSTGPPIEDAESRTIFVSNVHFGATKDSLSRHFNKCGEVLKVLILTDPATGLPKGSACVEFMKIDAAENALSLDGTSFMSRILKVVKKSSASPDVASGTAWAPPTRSFPFPVSGFGMIPFPRGGPNAYRGRPFKAGTRSLQWKRDVQSIPSQMSNTATNTVSPRGMTYVRSENNANGNTNDA